jgi:hypothetical protein
MGLSIEETAAILARCPPDATWKDLRGMVGTMLRSKGLAYSASDDPDIRPEVLKDLLAWINARPRTRLEERIVDLIDPIADGPVPPAPAVSPEIEGVPPPDEKLVRELKGNSRILFCYLWSRGNVTRDELRAVLHAEHQRSNSQAKLPSDRAVKDAVDYLSRRLSELKCHNTVVKKTGGLFYLRHPQK